MTHSTEGPKCPDCKCTFNPDLAVEHVGYCNGLCTTLTTNKPRKNKEEEDPKCTV